MQLTSGQAFYHRLCEACETQDLVSLGALYYPDAVSLSLSTGQVTRGREAILAEFTHAFQIAGAISFRSVESLVEAGEAVCVEATLATRFGQMQTYDIYLLQAGICAQHVSGLISPRPPGRKPHGQEWLQTQCILAAAGGKHLPGHVPIQMPDQKPGRTEFTPHCQSP